SAMANHQDQTVRGKVTDNNGNPLAGVSITLKSSSAVGTTTDNNGMYLLTVPRNAVLVFQQLGHVSQEISVGENREINVQMEADMANMEEVVVVGYGTQKKSHLTGAVSSISVKDNLEGRPIADIGRGIQGAAP